MTELLKMMLDFNIIKKIFDDCGLLFQFMKDKPQSWHSLISDLKYIPVAYTFKSLEYENFYSFSSLENYIDISIIITSNNKAIGIWPLTLSFEEDNFKLSSQGQSILSPLFIESLNVKEKKSIILKCYNSLKSLCREYKLDQIKCYDQFIDKSIHSISEWHYQFLIDNAKISINYTMFASLSGGIEKYRQYLRKSYKPLINQGLKIWTVKKLIGENLEVWSDFKSLHYKVSGGKTRSDKTWERQYDSIALGEAFLIYLLNDNKEMIGGGYFTFSKNEAVYSIGAYDRNLFDKPIGHVIQYEAIQEFIKRKIDWYKLGSIENYNDNDEFSKKMKSIQSFKNGFATHIMSEYIYTKFCR